MKIVATFDTVEKSLDVTMDGSPVEDVYEASFSKSFRDEFSCCVTTMSRDDVEGLSQMYRICAADSREAKAAPDAPDFPGLPGFKLVKHNPLTESVKAFFNKRD